VGVLLLLRDSSVCAEPSTLDWDAPFAECPSAEVVRRQVERYLGQPLEAERSQALRIRAEVRRTEQGDYSVAIFGEGESGESERMLRHQDCAKASEAAALVIALAIDPDRVLPAARESSDRALEAPPRVTPEATLKRGAPPAPVALRARAPGPASQGPSSPGGRRVALGPTAHGALGILPGTGLGLGVEVDLRLSDSFGTAFGGVFWPPRTENAGDPFGDAQVEVRLWSLGLRGCWLPVTETLGLGLCLGPDVGFMSGSGTGRSVGAPKTISDRSWHILGGIQAEYPPLGRRGTGFAMGVFRLEGGPALVRPGFALRGAGVVYQPADWSLRSLVGAEAVFP
jgi:hypothetical protein